MPVVPTTRVGKIEFYEAHLAPWTTSAVSIGLEATAVTALSTLTAAAREAYEAHLASRAAAAAAAADFHNKVRAMHHGPGAGADMIRDIRNFASTKNNPGVYVLAQIPAPAAPGTVPPPGTPFDFGVSLLQNGAVELKWRCNNPVGSQGTIYEVRRRVGASGPLVFVGASGARSFTDETLPAGATPCTYQLTAVRSTSRGNPAQFTVSFGVGAGSELRVESVTSGESVGVKLAA